MQQQEAGLTSSRWKSKFESLLTNYDLQRGNQYSNLGIRCILYGCILYVVL